MTNNDEFTYAHRDIEGQYYLFFDGKVAGYLLDRSHAIQLLPDADDHLVEAGQYRDAVIDALNEQLNNLGDLLRFLPERRVTWELCRFSQEFEYWFAALHEYALGQKRDHEISNELIDLRRLGGKELEMQQLFAERAQLPRLVNENHTRKEAAVMRPSIIHSTLPPVEPESVEVAETKAEPGKWQKFLSYFRRP
jgi:hypothetical protein